MRHFTITMTGHASQETSYIVTPAADEAEALADAIEALDPWGDRQLDAMRSAFSEHYVDTFTHTDEV